MFIIAEFLLFCFSDITILLNGHQLRAHRFVLAARSDDWGVADLSSADKLEFKGCLSAIFFIDNLGCIIITFRHVVQYRKNHTEVLLH